MESATFEEYQNTTVENSAQGLLEQALRLKNGEDCERDMDEAIRCLTEAAEQGSAEAARQLGICYAYGNGVRQDDVLSTEYYQKGAELGDSDSMYRLFRNKSIGIGCRADLNEADLWLKKAAEAGHSSAISTWNRFEQSGKLSRDLEGVENREDIGNRYATLSIERVSPSARLSLDRIAEPAEASVVSEDWVKMASAKSVKTLIAIYILGGLASGFLLKSVYENRISFMGSSSLISNFSSSDTFTLYMCVLGALLGLAMGLILSKLLNKVNESLILYFPLLLMPFIIMLLSSVVMGIAKGVVGLVLGILQITVYIVIGFSSLGSLSN